MLSVKELRDLHKLIDQIYLEADDLGMSWTEFAERAGVSPATVYRLGNYETPYPRANTVFLLARAVGFRVVLEKGRARHLKVA